MPEAFAGAVIPAPVTTVWRAVRDFGGLAAWQPAVARCVLSDAAAPTASVASARSPWPTEKPWWNPSWRWTTTRGP
ncbi:SRPBCC family protein [Streptomyces chrestomyceticus]|uniref:SRPBCC family protein n=1 Tax=Streptomyces chrestomyceticus TaxID=68185 RepID=UPI0037BC2E80